MPEPVQLYDYPTHTSRTSSGGGGTMSGGSGDGVTLKDYVDAQDSATRAGVEARIAEISATLHVIERSMVGWRSVWGAAAASVVAIAGLILAGFSIAGDRFDGGFAAGNAVGSFLAGQQERDAEQDKKLDQILNALTAAKP